MANNPLQLAKDALTKALEEKKKNQEIFKGLGPVVVETLQPILNEIALNSKLSKEELLSALSKIQINQAPADVKIPEIKIPAPQVTVNVPEIKTPVIPEIKIPAFTVPKPQVTVNVPEIKIPKLSWPEEEMDIKGWVRLQGVSLENPLPVQLRDASGKPVSLDITNVMGGGGGRGIVKISEYGGSAFSILQNGDGRIKVSVETGGSGLTDTELRATAVPISQVSGANWSVNISSQDFTFDTKQVSGSSDSVVVNDVLTTVGVNQVSGSNWSVSATQATSPWVISATDLDVRDLNIAQDELLVHQVSGSSWSVIANANNGVDIGDVTINNASGASAVNVQDGGNSITVDGTVAVTGSPTSVFSVGPVLHDSVDAGDAPVKIGGTAMQTNPNAVANGDIVRFTSDDLGRQLVRPVQARDLIATAYVNITTGIETTLLAGTAEAMYDLIYIMAANASGVAQTIDIRGITAGNVLMTISVPANGTAGVALPVPLPQTTSDTGNAWTVDNTSGSDLSNTSISISALFSKEV